MLIKFLTWCYRNLLELVAWLFLLMGVPLGILYKALSLKIIDLLQDWLPNFLVSYISLVTLLSSLVLVVIPSYPLPPLYFVRGTKYLKAWKLVPVSDNKGVPAGRARCLWKKA